ncbi:hypothetical protein [Dysgonomonas mossii]|nr:hypothetical protein [Dysgonomonas mossii]
MKRNLFLFQLLLLAFVMNAQPKKDFKTVRITYQTSMNGKAY